VPFCDFAFPRESISADGSMRAQGEEEIDIPWVTYGGVAGKQVGGKCVGVKEWRFRRNLMRRAQMWENGIAGGGGGG